MLDTEIIVAPNLKNQLEKFKSVRERTEQICSHLQIEDFVSQPITDVSPPKWHLAHTTWFFETFILKAFSNYRLFNKNYSFLFNSYYNSVGQRVLRHDRGKMTRPAVSEILKYRAHVNEALESVLDSGQLEEVHLDMLDLGLQHEMQHQELLYYDIKYILGINPISPVYDDGCRVDRIKTDRTGQFKAVDEGIYEIGHKGEDFSFDNEHGLHKVFLEAFEISDRPITNEEYLEFIEDGGYEEHSYWHSDAWEWLQKEHISAPLYWKNIDGVWKRFTLSGMTDIEPDEVLLHVSFYEASAFAHWKGMRLPTEFEWEVSENLFEWGNCWEWTNSAYLPYPYYKSPSGAVGEYNGKFMVNQMVLRGASKATYPGHSRKTYRNFFHPHLRWQLSGFRIARHK